VIVAAACLVAPDVAWAIVGGAQSATPQTVDRSATPDEVTTADGSVLQGTVLGMHDGKLALKNKFASTIQVSQSKVTTIHTTGELDVVMYDSRRLRGSLRSNSAGRVLITPADGSAPTTVEWKDIGEIWELPPNWDGSITFGLSENSGNSEAFGGTFGATAARNGERNRFSGRTHFSLLAASGETQVQKASGSLSYAHYLRARTFLHVAQDLLHDAGQDLQIQSASHVGVGYVILQRPASVLTASVGVGLLVNRYDVDTANDDTNLSGRGEVGMKVPLGDGVTLHNDMVLFVHDSTHMNNTLLLTFKLASDWKLEFGSNLQLSSDPSILADRWDHETRMGVTYSF
jgi:putative salt-induced outer membrane protein YdiY